MSSYYLIDFDDSFTFNIANDLWSYFNIEMKVVSYKNLVKEKKLFKDGDTLVLGPGPGHPDEYERIFPMIKAWLGNGKMRVIGICLGHQIIWRILGAEIVHSKKPIHGKAVSLELTKFWKQQFKINLSKIKVQRYNSLVVDRTTIKPELLVEYNCLFEGGELMASRNKNCLTMQFHPESIGTEHSQNILGCLIS